MRTKVSSSDEGGVAAGFAVLDSLYLTDKVTYFITTNCVVFKAY
jgi:glutathione synthase